MSKKIIFIIISVTLLITLSLRISYANEEKIVVWDKPNLIIFLENEQLLADKEGEQYVIAEEFIPGKNHFLSVSPNERFVVYNQSTGAIFGNILYYDFETKKSNILETLYDKERNIADLYKKIQWFLDSNYIVLEIERENIGTRYACVYKLFEEEFLKEYCLPDLIQDSVDSNSILTNNISDVSISADNNITFRIGKTDDNYEVWKTDIEGKEIKKIIQIFEGEEFQDFFQDIALDNKLYNIIYQAKSDGWLSGYPDGTIRLEDPVNRAEFAKLVIKAFKQKEIPIPEGMEYIFPDAPAKEWYAPTLYTATQLGLMQGYPDGTAKPEKTIIKVEALKIVLEMLGEEYTQINSQYQDTESNQWYSKYTDFAKRYGLIQSDKDKIYPAKDITRGEAIELISKVLEVRKEE